MRVAEPVRWSLIASDCMPVLTTAPSHLPTGEVEAAWHAHRAGVTAGLPVDKYTVTALVAATGRTRDRARILAALAVGIDAQLPVRTDPFVMTSVLKALMLAGEHEAAIDMYERALVEGMRPTPAVTNALSLVYAGAGDIERATALFETARERGAAGGAAGGAQDNASGAEGPDGVVLGEAADSALSIMRTDPTRGRDADTAVCTLLHACVRAGAPSRALATYEILAASGYVPSGSSPHAVLLAAAADAAAADGAAHYAEERRSATLSLHRLFDEAIASGVPADSRLLSALVGAFARIGDIPAALRAARRADELGVRPDLQLLRAVLQAYLRAPSAQRDALDWVTCAAAAHSISLRDVADLLVRAYLGSATPRTSASPPQRSPLDLPSSPRTSASPSSTPPPVSHQTSPTHLDAALELFERSRRHEWPLAEQTYRSLLSACSRLNRLPEAIVLLEHMENKGHAPGLAALDDVMLASHRAGDIDDQTLALWLAGSAEETQLLPEDRRGRSHSHS